MTMLERFISFAKGLPADRLEAMESALAEIMQSYSDEYEFTGEELAEIDRRVSVADPQFSDPNDITRLLGKPFSA